MPGLVIPSLDQEQIGLLTIAVSVLLAAISFVVRNVQSERARVLASREAFLSDQLRLLYGPLYAMSKANDAAYHAFRSTFAHAGLVYDPIADLSAEERGTWMLWTKTVFQPANLRMRDVIERNAHLFSDVQLPPVVIEFLAHTESYQALIETWTDDTAAGHREAAPFPQEFADYIEREYLRVSSEHARLVGLARGRGLLATRRNPRAKPA